MSEAEAGENEAVIDLAEFGRDLLRRRAAYEAKTGRPLDVPRNSGRRRTAGKLALLKAIEEAGGRW